MISDHGIRSEQVSEREIAETIRNLGRVPLGIDAAGDFRISIAGAQEKTLWVGRLAL